MGRGMRSATCQCPAKSGTPPTTTQAQRKHQHHSQPHHQHQGQCWGPVAGKGRREGRGRELSKMGSASCAQHMLGCKHGGKGGPVQFGTPTPAACAGVSRGGGGVPSTTICQEMQCGKFRNIEQFHCTVHRIKTMLLL